MRPARSCKSYPARSWRPTKHFRLHVNADHGHSLLSGPHELRAGISAPPLLSIIPANGELTGASRHRSVPFRHAHLPQDWCFAHPSYLSDGPSILGKVTDRVALGLRCAARILHAKETHMADEIEIPMTLPLDSRRLLRRECPTCEREFMASCWRRCPTGGTTAGGYYCPYWGIQAPADSGGPKRS